MNQPHLQSDERATARPVHLPTVLVVACSDAILARCWDAVAPLGVMIRDCEARGLATLAATRQPLAIVLPRALYALDPDELDALARDVRAALVKVDERGGGELEATLALAVRATMRRRDGRASSGRYSILPGDPLGGARPERSEPPPTSGTRPVVTTLEQLEDELRAALG